MCFVLTTLRTFVAVLDSDLCKQSSHCKATLLDLLLLPLKQTGIILAALDGIVDGFVQVRLGVEEEVGAKASEQVEEGGVDGEVLSDDGGANELKRRLNQEGVRKRKLALGESTRVEVRIVHERIIDGVSEGVEID